jgi:hypothetical protein
MNIEHTLKSRAMWSMGLQPLFLLTPLQIVRSWNLVPMSESSEPRSRISLGTSPPDLPDHFTHFESSLIFIPYLISRLMTSFKCYTQTLYFAYRTQPKCRPRSAATSKYCPSLTVCHHPLYISTVSFRYVSDITPMLHPTSILYVYRFLSIRLILCTIHFGTLPSDPFPSYSRQLAFPYHLYTFSCTEYIP